MSDQMSDRCNRRADGVRGFLRLGSAIVNVEQIALIQMESQPGAKKGRGMLRLVNGGQQQFDAGDDCDVEKLMEAITLAIAEVRS